MQYCNTTSIYDTCLCPYRDDHGDRSLIFSENNQRPVPVIFEEYKKIFEERILNHLGVLWKKASDTRNWGS